MKPKSKRENKIVDKKTLKEFLSKIIKEEIDTGPMGGVGNTNSNSLYNTFIQPFVDVGVTAAYGIEKLSAQAQTVLKGLIGGLGALIIPFYEFDFETFREQERSEIEKIKNKYSKTLKANIDAITTNDAFGMAFLLAPGAMLANQLVFKAPTYVLKLLGVMVGNNSEWVNKVNSKINSAPNIGFHDPGGHHAGAWNSGMDGGSSMDSYGFYEALNGTSENAKVLLEKNDEVSKELKGILSSKEFLNDLSKSPIIQGMKKDAVSVIVNHVKEVLAVNSYEELRKKSVNDAGFAQISAELMKLNQSGQFPKENNPVAANVLLGEIKKGFKNFWIKKINQMISQYPESSKELMAAIKEINAIKV